MGVKMAEAMHPGIRDVTAKPQYIVKDSASIHPTALIGYPAEARDRRSTHPARVKAGATIRECVRVHAGTERDTVIGERTLLMAGSHVGHDAVVGDDVEIAPNAVIGGHAEIGDRSRVGMGAVVLPYIRVGADVRIGAGAVVTWDVPDGETWVGNPAKPLR
jgi:UDP-N-acetylglucosamine acyltransferase